MSDLQKTTTGAMPADLNALHAWLEQLAKKPLSAADMLQFIDISGASSVDQYFSRTTARTLGPAVTDGVQAINPHWTSIQLVHTALTDFVADPELGNYGAVFIESAEDCYNPSVDHPISLAISKNTGDDVQTDLYVFVDDYPSEDDYALLKSVYKLAEQYFPFSEVVKIANSTNVKNDIGKAFIGNASSCFFIIDAAVELDHEALALWRCTAFQTLKCMDMHMAGTLKIPRDTAHERAIHIKLDNGVLKQAVFQHSEWAAVQLADGQSVTDYIISYSHQQ